MTEQVITQRYLIVFKSNLPVNLIYMFIIYLTTLNVCTFFTVTLLNIRKTVNAMISSVLKNKNRIFLKEFGVIKVRLKRSVKLVNYILNSLYFPKD